MKRPNLPEISPEAMDRLAKIESLRSLRDLLVAGSAQSEKACRCTLAQFQKEADELGIPLDDISAAIDALTAAFQTAYDLARIQQLRLIEAR